MLLRTILSRENSFYEICKTLINHQAPYSPDLAANGLWLCPKFRISLEKKYISEEVRHNANCNKPAVHHAKKGFPAVLPVVAESLEEVFSSSGGVL